MLAARQQSQFSYSIIQPSSSSHIYRPSLVALIVIHLCSSNRQHYSIHQGLSKLNLGFYLYTIYQRSRALVKLLQHLKLFSATATKNSIHHSMAVSQSPLRIRHLNATVAQQIDNELLSPAGGFSIDQLMELAGLSCAQVVYICYPPHNYPNVLVACGPGNQGGDGLVAARHLYHLGYEPTIWYPKEGKTDLFKRLKTQLHNLRLNFIATEDFQDAVQDADVVLDSIFGFSFKGPVREPFKDPIEILKYESMVEFEARKKMPPIVSVDIPSSWDVERGNIHKAFTPSVLISLTAPKLGSLGFPGRHFLGGRFVSEEIEDKFDLRIPEYPGTDHMVEITGVQPIQDEKNEIPDESHQEHSKLA